MGRRATYKITLSQDEREELQEITRRGRESARKVLYARALLLLDAGDFGEGPWKVSMAAQAVGMSSRTLEHLKKRFVMYGLDAALERKKPCRPSREVIFDGEFEAQLLQLACSPAPEGYARWSIRLLRDKLIELEIVPTVSTMTVHNALKKMKLSLI